MDASEEELVNRIYVGAATTVLLLLKAYLIRRIKRNQERMIILHREPYVRRELFRNQHMSGILNGSSSSCVDYLRMRMAPFLKLAKMIRELSLVKDTIHVTVEEQLAMFLHIVGHKTKNRVMRVEFIRSGETVSRYFNQVLRAIFALRSRFMKQPTGQTPPEILNNPLWYPWFKDCIGMIDGTHVEATVPLALVPRFRGRKGVTQNILAACTPDKLFTYVLAGWEGAANDYTVLKDALSLPSPNSLRVLEGKYYLCDAGYTTGHGFISPYRGVRYHLKEHTGRTPKNRFELFNLRHSSLRTKIECCFGILKNRFKILSAKPHYPFPTQVDIVLACTILHNYIATVDPEDELLNEEVQVEGEEVDVADEDGLDVIQFASNQTQAELRANRQAWKQRRDQIAWDMWVHYCQEHRGGDIIESEW